jgi:integrase
MLRHACGFALANADHDTWSLQAYLGHRNIQHTVRTPNWLPIGSRNSGRTDLLQTRIARLEDYGL